MLQRLIAEPLVEYYHAILNRCCNGRLSLGPLCNMIFLFLLFDLGIQLFLLSFLLLS